MYFNRIDKEGPGAIKALKYLDSLISLEKTVPIDLKCQ